MRCCLVHVVALVVSGGHGPERLDLVDGAFGGVAPAVLDLVERRRPSAGRAFALAVGDLVGRLGDGGPDAVAAAPGADGAVGVRLVAQDTSGTPAGRPTPVRDADAVEDGDEFAAVVALAGGWCGG